MYCKRCHLKWWRFCMTCPWALLVMRNLGVKTAREKYLWIFQPRDLWIALDPVSHPIQLSSKYGVEYPLGQLLPSLDCRLHLKLFCTSALRGSVCISCPFGDLGMTEGCLPWWKVFQPLVVCPSQWNIQLTPPLLLHNYVEGWIPTSLSAIFIFPSLVFISEEFEVCPSGTIVGKHGGEDYQHPCDFIRTFASKWESSDEYLRPVRSVQVQGISKPKSRTFYFLQKWNRDNKLKLRKVLNFLCSEDIMCKKAKKDGVVF